MWLWEALDEDLLVLIYQCEDESHGGWCVLGWSAGSLSGDEITAYPTEPGKPRMIVYTIEDIKEMFGVEHTNEINQLKLGAWNGGRIVKLVYLPKEKAAALENYIAEVTAAAEITHTYTGELSNADASEEAKALYAYIRSVDGNGILTGQQESTWMGSPDYEMDYIEEKTGKLPAIRGLDFMHNDFAGCVERAKEWNERGGIVTIGWHTGADFASGYNECLADDPDWEKMLTEGTEEYQALLDGMDRAVPYLTELRDAGIPVLWRPFHEFDGAWFWWGKGGSENFKTLWRLMYDRYTNVWGLNNLIWVLGYSVSGLDMGAWYPGDECVDIIGADSYTAGANHELYEKVKEIAAEGMPVALHECGNIPTEAELKENGTGWVWFMTWHTDWLTNEEYNPVGNLKEIYQSDYFITLDEVTVK